jgi:hypothetical protein
MSRGCFIFGHPADSVAKSFGEVVHDAHHGLLAQPASYLPGSGEKQLLAASPSDSHPLDWRINHSRFDAPSQMAPCARRMDLDRENRRVDNLRPAGARNGTKLGWLYAARWPNFSYPQGVKYTGSVGKPFAVTDALDAGTALAPWICRG